MAGQRVAVHFGGVVETEEVDLADLWPGDELANVKPAQVGPQAGAQSDPAAIHGQDKVAVPEPGHDPDRRGGDHEARDTGDEAPRRIPPVVHHEADQPADRCDAQHQDRDPAEEMILVDRVRVARSAKPLGRAGRGGHRFGLPPERNPRQDVYAARMTGLATTRCPPGDGRESARPSSACDPPDDGRREARDGSGERRFGVHREVLARRQQRIGAVAAVVVGQSRGQHGPARVVGDRVGGIVEAGGAGRHVRVGSQ